MEINRIKIKIVLENSKTYKLFPILDTGASKTLLNEADWPFPTSKLNVPQKFRSLTGSTQTSKIISNVKILIKDINKKEHELIIPEVYILQNTVSTMLLGNNFINSYSPMTVDITSNIFTLRNKKVIIPRYFVSHEKSSINRINISFEEQYLQSL